MEIIQHLDGNNLNHLPIYSMSLEKNFSHIVSKNRIAGDMVRLSWYFSRKISQISSQKVSHNEGIDLIYIANHIKVNFRARLSYFKSMNCDYFSWTFSLIQPSLYYLSLFPNSELEEEMVCSQQKFIEVLRVEEGKKLIIKMCN